MTDDYILNKGYKQYNPTKFHSEYTTKCFQKRFDDDIGKKYFIDINKYSWNGLIPKNAEENYTHEYEVKLYKKDTHDALNITFHCNWKLEDVEIFIEKLFQTNQLDYYEKWDE